MLLVIAARTARWVLRWRATSHLRSMRAARDGRVPDAPAGSADGVPAGWAGGGVVRPGGPPLLSVLSSAGRPSAHPVRLAGRALPGRPAGPARPVRNRPPPAAVGEAGPVRPRPVPRLGRRRLRLHPAGRRRSPHGPP